MHCLRDWVCPRDRFEEGGRGWNQTQTPRRRAPSLNAMLTDLGSHSEQGNIDNRYEHYMPFVL
jgi:hypothetical protein